MMNLILPAAHAATDVIGSATPITKVLANLLKFLLSVVGVVAIIAIVIAGILYFFAAGDERRIQLAKNALLFAIVGLIVALGGLVLVNTLGTFFQ